MTERDIVERLRKVALMKGYCLESEALEEITRLREMVAETKEILTSDHVAAWRVRRAYRRLNDTERSPPPKETP